MSGFVSDGLNKFGPFGRYNEVATVNNATVHFSSSLGGGLGAAAIIVGEASTTGTATLARGGTINLAHLTVGRLYEVGISSITCNAKNVYVLKR